MPNDVKRRKRTQQQQSIELWFRGIEERARHIATLNEEREKDLKKKRREKDLEDVAQFNDEEKALLLNPNAESTMTGRMIRRHGSAAYYGNNGSEAEKEIAKALYQGIITAGILNAVVYSVTPLSGSFQDPSRGKNTGKSVKYEDKDYIYDTARVDAQTKSLLDQESAIIETKISEMQAVDNPAQRERMALAIIKLAEDFEMRPHPITQRYVHSEGRVERELAKRRVLEKDCHGEVCVFRVKMEIGDLRGVKRTIGDQFNQDPQELIASGDHTKVEPVAKPIPPPHLTLS